MTHALEEAHLNTRLDGPALSRPVAANQPTSVAHRANAPAAARKPARSLSMRWSTGPDGRLHCTWQRPTPWKTNQTEDPVARRRAGLASEGASTLTRDRGPEALAAC
jgi:hypothetical protein